MKTVPRKKVSRILARILIFMSLIALLPLVIAALSIRTFNTLHQQEVEERQADVINKIDKDIEVGISSMIFALTPQYNKPIQNLVTVRDGKVSFSPVSEETLETLVSRLMDAIPGVKMVGVVDSLSKLQVAVSSKDFPGAAKMEKFQNFEVPIVLRAIKEKKAQISSLKSTVLGPQITIAAPIKTLSGEVPGVIVAVINLKQFFEQIVSKNEIERAGYVFITDHQGRLLIHSRIKDAAPVSLLMTDLVGSLALKGEIKTEGQKRYMSFWNQNVIGSGRMKSLDGMERPIGIFIELPAEEADLIVVQLIERFSIITFLVLFLGGLLTAYLTISIITPISELERGTARVEQGKFDEPVNIKSGDEIEDLGHAFNKMMKGLKRLEELREEFVFIAAHELRTPVTAIKGYIQLVLEEFTGDAQAKVFLTKANAANERLIHLVDDLLEVAREEAGRLEIKVSPIAIAEPINQILTELKPLADDKKIIFEYAPKNIPLVLADATRIKEVMVNLVGNALKYTLERGVVTISHELKGDMLVTHIKDTGFGISKKDQEKLFEKFYRVQTEKNKDIKGTGLGLFIVKTIIEKMGGKIWVESAEGKGSTFSFELPLVAPQSSTNSLQK